MNSFLIALQFLTRINLVKQSSWSMENFGKSVVCFPLVGLCIGFLMYGVYYALNDYLEMQLLALILVIFEFLLTGGLHADGFMDTCDGIFSGRDRERKLEIMKDSCVGSNAVVGFVFLTLLKWQLIYHLPEDGMFMALVAMPLLSRYSMTLSIKLFVYARPEGMGKAFAEFSPAQTVAFTTAMTIGAAAFFDLFYFVFLGITVLSNLWLNRFITKELGGTTGDTYGFVCEVSELIFLLAFILLM